MDHDSSTLSLISGLLKQRTELRIIRSAPLVLLLTLVIPNMEVTASRYQKRSTSILPPGTVHHEDQFEKENLEYRNLWSNVMDEGKYIKASAYINVEVLILC